MTEPPRLVDNRSRYAHQAALAWLAEDMLGTHLSVASGYVRMGGLHALATLPGNRSRPIRLLLGAAPEPGLGMETLPAEEGVAAFRRFEEILASLKDEGNFDRFPPSRRAILEAVERWLREERVAVRRYTRRFLHGKCYLFADSSGGRLAGRGATLITSANLTTGGLTSNLELGLVDYNPDAVGEVAAWFDELWSEAEEFKDQLLQLLFPPAQEYDPETIFLRALLELYGPEVESEERGGPRPSELTLVDFQRDGVKRARRILQQFGGVIYADGVGMGKTHVAAAFVDEYAKQMGYYTLVIAPAQLRDHLWEPLLKKANLPHEVVSPQQLAEDRQVSARGKRSYLAVDKDAYRLVIVDEAHAFRNVDTTWYAALDRLLGGAKKDLLLLTATPVNNTLWDLHNLVALFARHDAAFLGTRLRIPSLKRLFLDAGALDPENVAEEKLFPLLDAVAVRRDRTFIQRHYPNASLPDGTPIRFPLPRLYERRYDLDAVYPGVFHAIVSAIGSLTMARYRPSAYERGGTGEAPDERALAGLMQSALLKRFESSHAAALSTVRRLISVHEALVSSWEEHGRVPSLATLREVMMEEVDGTPLPVLVAEALERDTQSRPISDFDPKFLDDVKRDLTTLREMERKLRDLASRRDPKLEVLADILRRTKAGKVAVFSSFADTIRYLEEAIRHDPGRFGGRKMTVVIGSERDADTRHRELLRFCPQSVSGVDGYRPEAEEVDLLLATDVLAEGQNLQEAQAVISYDLPWNPQRVVQRYGRVIRLKSPHREVYLYTMLPEEGALEEVLRLEARVRTKIAIANATFGMEAKILSDMQIEERNYADLKDLTTRLSRGDETVLDEGESPGSGSFAGEEYRARILRALREGEVARLRSLPWGIGSCFVSRDLPADKAGVFFACKTKEGDRHWRFVPFEVSLGKPLVRDDLEILRRIDPKGAPRAEFPEPLDLERLWDLAAADICRAHAERLDPRKVEEAIPLVQRWALNILRDPSLPREEAFTYADECLGVGRNQLVRRRLSELRKAWQDGELTTREAAEEIAKAVRELGLRPTEKAAVPRRPLTRQDLGVVCYQVVLGAGGERASVPDRRRTRLPRE